jgi:hypothetical protein
VGYAVLLQAGAQEWQSDRARGKGAALNSVGSFGRGLDCVEQ